MQPSSQNGFGPATLDGPRAQRLARIAGVLFIITFVTSIPALLLYDPLLNDAGYVLSAGAHTRIELGAFLEVMLAIAGIGTAVVLFPILRRQSEGIALGYVACRVVEYPKSLSRGLVLVKWWLLALPHYLVVGVFTGGAFAGFDQARGHDAWAYGSGLIGLLVCIAAIVLLFAGRYPRGIYDLVMGMNRWALRVTAYAALMTDRYPPFRLDMGGHEPPGEDASPTVTPDPLPAS